MKLTPLLILCITAGICIILLPAAIVSGGSDTGFTWLISAASDGTQANNYSARPAISSDGHYVAFASPAYNLVEGDTNGAIDVFIHNVETAETMRVSVSSAGLQANKNSDEPVVSFDGRYIAFVSSADNLVPNDGNNQSDTFFHDRITGQTERITVASDGTEENGTCNPPVSMSSGGRYVAFTSFANNLIYSDTNGTSDIFVRDRSLGETILVTANFSGTQANKDSEDPSLSADGRYVAFESRADNLVGNDTNNASDIFVRDLQTGEVLRVSIASDGTEGNANSADPVISANARYVAFASLASNLVNGDTNSHWDIFIHDRWTGTTKRGSISSGGIEGYLDSGTPAISDDGTYMAFYSVSSNLIAGDRNQKIDVFVHNQHTGETIRVSVGNSGSESNADSYNSRSSITTDGRYIVFHSGANNLVLVDVNDTTDIFLRDRGLFIKAYLPLILKSQ